MRIFSKPLLVTVSLVIVSLAMLASAAWAQATAPGFPAPAPRATPAPRAASCHNGANFDRFLADLKQQALAAGVSQRAIGEAAPYLVYDQGIVNRDRGQRVFGQIFTQFAGRMAAPFRMQQGDRKSTRLNSSHGIGSRMPSSA